jgi:hypothetical protein
MRITRLSYTAMSWIGYAAILTFCLGAWGVVIYLGIQALDKIP